MPTPEQAALLATERWSWLAELLDRWYAEPLSAADGSTPAELAAAANRVGRPLPRTLTEWFTLVGRRLRPIQDAPATPTDLTDDGELPVWFENQRCWTMLVDGEGDDPDCAVDEPEDFPFPPAPLSAVLHGMLLSDMFVGAWSGEGFGPLGRLAPEVVGGLIQLPSAAESAAVVEALGPLPVAVNPFFERPLYGDATTLVRNSGHLEWLTADAAGLARFGELVDLDPAGGEHEVVLVFESPPAEVRRRLTDDRGLAVSRPFTEAVGDLGRIRIEATGRDLRFQFGTVDPKAVAAALRGALSAGLAEHAVLATRPERITRYRVIHPADRAQYRPSPEA